MMQKSKKKDVKEIRYLLGADTQVSTTSSISKRISHYLFVTIILSVFCEQVEASTSAV